MEKLWKRSGGWVIALKSDLFTWARVKLTVVYLLIIAIILAVFSFALYRNFSQGLRRDFYRGDVPARRLEQETFAEDAIERAKDSILTFDIFIFLISAGLSYMLAGYTLSPIRKALQAQKQFSADASHELRTPLAVMRNETEVLLRGNQALPADSRAVLESNLEEIKFMSQLVEQLLEVSRGQEPYWEDFRRLDLGEIVQEVATKFSKLAAGKKLRLSFHKPAEAVLVNGDLNNLRRMLGNILTNAINYTPPNGSVNVVLSSRSGQALITISDNGVGIPAKDLPKIFERFYKVDRPNSLKVSGSGLGLAIARQIVLQHQGSIEINSVLDQGTTVNVQIPKIS